MKKVTLLCGLLLAMTATVAAAAQGVGLRWNGCLGDGGLINRNFACNSNSGTNNLVGTFELGADLLTVSGNEIVIDVATAGAALPAWWAFRNAGTCRQAALSMNSTVSPLAVNCADWANGQSAGGIGAWNIGLRGPNTARMVAALAVPLAGLADLAAGQEYFSFNLLFNNTKTVGTGSCEGCSVPACLVFNSIKLTTPIAVNDRRLTGPSNGFDADFCTWQGGAGIVVPPYPGGPGGTGCGGATPTKNTTWGAVKSLYH